MAARLDPGGLSVSLHLLLYRLDRQRILLTLLVPEEVVAGRDQRPVPQALVQARERIYRQVDPAVFSPLPLLNQERLLLPVDVADFKTHYLRHPQAATQHEQEERPVQPVLDHGEELPDLLA